MKTFTRVWLSISLIAIGIGIGLIVIATASGASWKDIATFSIDESYTGVTSLDMKIGYGNVKIVEGDEFSISADNLPENEFDSYVEDGTWYIKENERSIIEIVNIELPRNGVFWWDDHFTPNITITIPKGFKADQFKLNLATGRVEADSIQALEGEFSVGAGELHINHLTVDNKSKYSVGTGEMELKDIIAKDVDVENGVGSAKIEGSITGNNTITCDVGHISLKLNGDKEDYSYDIDSDIGDVEIDGESYHGISNKVISNNNAENKIVLDNNIGNITVEFN